MFKSFVSPIAIRAVLSFLILCLLCGNTLRIQAAPLHQQEPPVPATVSLPAEAESLSTLLIVNTEMQKSQQPKLDTALAKLAAKTTLPEQLAFAQSESLRLSADRVQVQVTVRSAGLTDVIQAVQDAGGEVTGVGTSKAVIQGWLPTTSLTTLTANPDVLLIRRPVEATVLQNEIVSEGASEANVPAWHNVGWLGQNTKIAIIDSGFAGYTDLLGSELPTSVTIRNFVDGESDAQIDDGSDHGTACAEIAYDLAPAAQFFLVKVATDIDLEEAVSWLINVVQVDIISTSIGWYGITPRDGTGFFADLVQRAHASGVFGLQQRAMNANDTGVAPFPIRTTIMPTTLTVTRRSTILALATATPI